MEHPIQKSGCGVLVGRFQTPELHEGHRRLIEAVMERHAKVAIFLGVSKALFTDRNPLDFMTRQLLLETAFPRQLIIQPLPDMPDDHDWSQELDRRIREVEPVGPITLYGARDSFLPYYHGQFEVHEITVSNVDISGTDLREQTTHSVLPSRDFRAGVIYACMRRYPAVYPTVDIAVLRHHNTQVLLGRKPQEQLLRFPGGFADPTDASFEAAAEREIREEAGPLQLGPMRHVGSCRVDDWRYRPTRDRIITQLYACEWLSGEARANDDIAAVGWYDLATLYQQPQLLVPEHRPLLSLLQSNIQPGHE
jgi:bifunctional NMN adenylyltransferase/nudix hydrolase